MQLLARLALALVAEDPRAFEGERAVAVEGNAAEPVVATPREPAAGEPTTATPTAEPTTTAPTAETAEPTAAEPTTAEPTTATPTAADRNAAPNDTATSPATAQGKPATPTASSDGAAATQPKRYLHPLLVIAGGPVIGPHAFGNEECREELARCETTGTFFGVGANLELRVRVWRPLYLHARGVIVGNVAPRQRDPLYQGFGGAGIGFGAYGRHVFGRAEYLLVDAIGSDRFGRPFGDGSVGRDRWGHHAGLFSAGGRLHFRPRLSGELWGGLMVGPRSHRQLPDEPIERRTLLTFLAGINIAYDLVPARDR